MKIFLLNGEVETYRDIEMVWKRGKKPILHIYDDGKIVERIKLMKYKNHSAIVQLFQEKGFEFKSIEELEKEPLLKVRKFAKLRAQMLENERLKLANHTDMANSTRSHQLLNESLLKSNNITNHTDKADGSQEEDLVPNSIQEEPSKERLLKSGLANLSSLSTESLLKNDFAALDVTSVVGKSSLYVAFGAVPIIALLGVVRVLTGPGKLGIVRPNDG